MISFDSEKHLEDLICSELDMHKNPISDEIISRYVRQPDFKPYGIGDILTVHDCDDDEDEEFFSINIIELKNERLQMVHLSQIARYRKFFMDTDENFHAHPYEFTLVCKKSESFQSDLIFLANSIEWLNIYEFSLSFENGVCFELLGGYSMTDKDNAAKKAFNLLDIRGERNANN